MRSLGLVLLSCCFELLRSTVCFAEEQDNSVIIMWEGARPLLPILTAECKEDILKRHGCAGKLPDSQELRRTLAGELIRSLSSMKADTRLNLRRVSRITKADFRTHVEIVALIDLLGELREAGSVRVLIDFINFVSDPSLRWEELEAIRVHIGRPKIGHELRPIPIGMHPLVAGAEKIYIGCQAIVNIGPTAVPVLEEAIVDEGRDIETCWRAMAVLVKINDKDGSKAVTKYLSLLSREPELVQEFAWVRAGRQYSWPSPGVTKWGF